MNEILARKFEKLKNYIKEQNKVIIAYSGGVDSSFLLKVAQIVLKDNVTAITVFLNAFPSRELDFCADFCKENNISHKIIKFNELDIEDFKNNTKNRCYYCKKAIFEKIIEVAKENGITNILEGSNIDDDKDYRPGHKAIKELNIKSPLRYSNLSKEEIRILSKELNLKTYSKASFACLASRFQTNEPITKEKLKQVEKSEQFLFDLGFKQFRVRYHNDLARIEIEPKEFSKMLENKKIVSDELKKYGFRYVSLDLEGYKTGNMN